MKIFAIGGVASTGTTLKACVSGSTIDTLALAHRAQLPRSSDKEPVMKRALAILALAVAGFSLPAPAAAGPSPHMRFGMVGVVLGQTARLNVVVDNPDLTNPPDPDRTCAVELMFLDAMGNVLARSMESLMPGHAAFLDFMNGRVAPAPGIDNPDLPPGQRLQLRGAVNGIDNPNTRGGRPGACAGLIATLEVFNSQTGETMVFQNPVLSNPPDGDRPAGR